MLCVGQSLSLVGFLKSLVWTVITGSVLKYNSIIPACIQKVGFIVYNMQKGDLGRLDILLYLAFI